jgi:DNA-binding LytR/AlgR family response regulator
MIRSKEDEGMKITIEDRPDGGEDEIIIRCKQVDEHLLKLVYALKACQEKLTVTRGADILQVMPSEVFYFEAVDNKVFLYLEKDVYETKQKLYELEERFRGTDFVRVSKSVILNLSKVKSLSPAFNGRFEATMKNGEKVIVSRQYVPVLKEKLGL